MFGLLIPFLAVIVVGCVLVEAHDRLARRYGWPR